MSILVLTGILFSYVPKSYAQGGQDWTEPVNLSFSGVGIDPLMVIDSNGTLHALWIDNFNSDNSDGYSYSQSLDGGVSWTPPQLVNFPFSEKDSLPTMLADSNGFIHIFWINSTSNLFYGQTPSSDLANPVNWQTNTRLDADVLTFDVILDSRGVLHIAYVSNSKSNVNPAGVYYRQSEVGGGSWDEAVNLYASAYFRSLKETEAFVRVATSNALEEQTVYVTWDNLLQKRVFMAISKDSGLNWDQAQQIKGPQDTGSIDTPFNLNVAASENKVLLMWQVGQPDSAKCTVFSQWSEDGGESWDDSMVVLGGRGECPLSTKFVVQNEDYMVALMTGQVNPTLVAWNGERWSEPQTQTQPPAISDPITFETLLLGCRFDLIDQNRLYVLGCDQGRGGDVWLVSRPLEPVENWFSSSSSWEGPVVISEKSDMVSHFSSVSDTRGIVHAIWSRSYLADDDSQKNAIEYAQWDGAEWTNPEPVISSLSGVPSQIALSIDAQERLLLAWVDSNSGELFFSWANLERASLVSEWGKPVGLPSESNLNNNIDIVSDGAGRIVVVYTISINENRGVYVIQSTDNGDSWSDPVRAFDAVSARWERVKAPKISLSSDGVLHLLFTRDTERIRQSVGLYYSRSLDGGMTWSDVKIVSEGDTQWSDIVCYDDRAVHILWQENDGLVFANLSQVSQDSGTSWGKTLDITGVNDSSTLVDLATDGLGNLHFIQLLKNRNASTEKQDNLTLQDWKWTGLGWEFASSRNFVVRGQEKKYSLTADITSDGILGVSMSVKYSDSENNVHNEILTFKRFLDDPKTLSEPIVALIPTPLNSSGATEIPEVTPTQSVDLSTLRDDSLTSSRTVRNILGIIIIVVVLVVTGIILIRRRKVITNR
jgi:hypothetical protein